MKNLPLAILLLLSSYIGAQENDPVQLFINEVQVANIDQFLDNANCYGSWMELYNPTDAAIPLKGMTLVSGADEYRFTTLSIWGNVPAGGYKVIFFDHNQTQGNYGSASRGQIPFKLEPDGGSISLLDSNGKTVASADYPPAIARCSWARTEDGGNAWDFTGNPTPGESNSSSQFAEFRLEAPEVDVPSGVFSESFVAKVSIPAGCTLRYTLDGSTPTASNGETSADGRFNIASTTILRLAFLMEDYLPSPVTTRSYIYKNHEYYLPILSVVSDPKHFFDNKIGVFVRGTNGISGNGQSSACNWNMDWERPVNMEYLVPERSEGGDIVYQEVLNQEVDLEICGGWTRAYGGATVDGHTWEARSSFRLKTDKRYEGVGSIAYPVFPAKPYNKYRCWQVRNGGNDTYARTKDPAIQMMVQGSGFYVDCQDYQPAHVFLNGLYYGMLNIRESNNKHYAYSNYGISFEDMDQFDLSNAQYNQKMGDNKAWQQLLRLAQRLASTKSEELFEQVCELLDIDEYINYMALECYMGPTDWITNTNNVKGFRSRSDGKFHFVLFDLDSAFGISSMLTTLLSTSAGVNVDDLFRYLMRYEPFRQRFMDAFCIVDGSVFEPSRCEEIVNAIYDNTSPALRFEGSNASRSLISTIGSAHGGTRMTNLRDYFKTDFSLFANVSSNISGARLSLNGQEIPTGKYDGYLFSRSGLPIELSTSAPGGYVFNAWELESETTVTSTLIPFGAQWMYYDRGSMDGKDWKSLAFDETAARWRSGTAPFGFASEGYYMQENSATKLNQGYGSKRPTYYFRHTFQLDEVPSDGDVLTFSYQVDDGLMLYVNGHEAYSYYVTSGSTYSDFTTDGHYESQQPHIGSFDIPLEFLTEGTNQIAVEVKNCHANSTDIWFEASLTFTRNPREVLSTEATVNLREACQDGSNLLLKARFSPIASAETEGDFSLRINEVDAYGDVHIDENGRKGTWVELYNPTDRDIELKGWTLTNSTGGSMSLPLTPTLGGELPLHRAEGLGEKVCGPGAFCVVFLPLERIGGTLRLVAPDGTVADSLQYVEHGKWQSIGRYPDGAGQYALFSRPTIGRSNSLCLSDIPLLTDDPTGILPIPYSLFSDSSADDFGDDFGRNRDHHGEAVREVQYFNLSGQRIQAPSGGICIRKVIYEDGTSSSSKLYR